MTRPHIVKHVLQDADLLQRVAAISCAVLLRSVNNHQYPALVYVIAALELELLRTQHTAWAHAARHPELALFGLFGNVCAYAAALVHSVWSFAV